MEWVIPQTGHGTPVIIFDGHDGVFNSPTTGIFKCRDSPDCGSDRMKIAPMINAIEKTSIMIALCLRGDKRDRSMPVTFIGVKVTIKIPPFILGGDYKSSNFLSLARNPGNRLSITSFFHHNRRWCH